MIQELAPEGTIFHANVLFGLGADFFNNIGRKPIASFWSAERDSGRRSRYDQGLQLTPCRPLRRLLGTAASKLELAIRNLQRSHWQREAIRLDGTPSQVSKVDGRWSIALAVAS